MKIVLVCILSFLGAITQINAVEANSLLFAESLKVMLLCGSDLLESFTTPGVWIPNQVP